MKWTCPRCGFSFSSDDATKLPVSCAQSCGCVDETGAGFSDDDGAPLDPPPSAARRVVTFAGAFARWVAAGCPIRTDPEVEALFRDHCAGCKYFDGDTCTHAACGCQVRDVAGEKASVVGRLISTAFANKLRWRTEQCPIGKWE